MRRTAQAAPPSQRGAARNRGPHVRRAQVASISGKLGQFGPCVAQHVADVARHGHLEVVTANRLTERSLVTDSSKLSGQLDQLATGLHQHTPDLLPCG